MPLLWMDNNGDRWDTHHGLVVGGPYTRCVRVMSDIYSNEEYAQVWNPDTMRVDEVHIGGAFELNTKGALVVVDAPAAIVTLISAQQTEAARKAEEDRAKREVLAPTKGRTVVVVGGRKVKKGTKGTVFWTDSPTNPARVGIKDANDATHWVDARWCETVYADFPVGGAPACGWVAYRDALRAQEEGYKATLPKVRKGDEVTLSTSGLTGKVFWAKDTRIGVGFGTKRDAAGNYIEKAWANLSEVAAVNGVPVNPAASAEQEQEPTVDETGATLPWPYSAISVLNIEDGVYAAYDAKGGFLLHLDNEGAEEVFRLLPHVTLQAAVGV